MNGEKKEQWSFIPYSLRDNRNVSDGAKVLYLFLINLCSQEGYCWATNKYLSDITGKSEANIKRCLVELKTAKQIEIDIIRDDKKQVVQRKIFLTLYSLFQAYIPLGSNMNPPRLKYEPTLPLKNEPTLGSNMSPIELNKKELNKSELNIPLTPLEGEEPKKPQPSISNDNEKDTKEMLFDEFWKEYPSCKRKVNKTGCKKAYLNITKLKQEHETIMEGLRLWKKDEEWEKYGGQYIPAPLVFIHQRKWEGKVEVEKEKAEKEKEEEERNRVTQEDVDKFNKDFFI